MAATITYLGDFFDRSNGYERRIGLYTGPASYVTGGDPVTPEQMRLKQIEHFDFSMAWTGVSTSVFYQATYDRVNKKIVWVNPSTGLEVGAATNLSTYSADFECVGK